MHFKHASPGFLWTFTNMAQCLTLLKPPTSGIKPVSAPEVIFILYCVFKASLFGGNASSPSLSSLCWTPSALDSS